MTAVQPAMGFVVLSLCAGICMAQNVIENREPGESLPPISITEEQARACIEQVLFARGEAVSLNAQRIQRKLNQHVDRWLQGAPWMPFHHTLGISGYEIYFDHPDELFYAVSIALPFLTAETATKAKHYLAGLLPVAPPYAVEGFERREGRPRESYRVPDGLRQPGRGGANSAFGVYAFWAFCHYAEEPGLARSHWPAVQARIAPLLERHYRLDIHKTEDARDEAERLNGDLAGLIGFARLARLNEHDAVEERAITAVRQVLELRVNLERVNPQILEKAVASKSLHLSKLTRFCTLTPEVAHAIGRWSAPVGSERLKAFRHARNGWYLAFGERMIGGENYTNPLHFSRALFSGAVFLEGMDSEALLSWVDVPWCQGDLYFIEKCALALWAAEGRGWTKNRSGKP